MHETVLTRLSRHLVVGLEGIELTGRERELLGRFPPAGIILFSRNVHDAGQVRRLTADVIGIVAGAGGHHPLIAADHEGGRISVLAAAIGAPPAQMAIGRAASVSCGDVFRETARRLRYCNVNTLLAPVADVNVEYLNPVIGVRAFGEESTHVARLVRDAVSALREEGIVSCLKHFPGHGSSRTDSHFTLPFLPFTLEELVEREMAPFVHGIEAGAEMVMTAHVAPRGRFVPASLDPEIITMLRKKLGFGGVVVTDALEMAGVRVQAGEVGAEPFEPLPIGEIAARALAAGNDLLIFSRPFGEVAGELEAGAARSDGALNAAAGAGVFRGVLSGVCAQESRGRIEQLCAGLRIYGDRPSEHDWAIPPGEPAGGAGTDADIYRLVAHHAIQFSGTLDARMPAIEAGRSAITFLGERGDFANDIVARFAAELARTLGASDRDMYGTGGGKGVRPGGDRQAPFPGDAFDVALRCEAPGSGEPMEIVAVKAGRPYEGAAGIVVLLNRRPLSRHDCERLCHGAACVIVAGWAYAARFLPSGTPVVVTYGVYDAAVDAVGAVMTGHPTKTD